MVADLLDEGSGDLDSKTFHERLDRRAIELSFSSTADDFRGPSRMLKDNKDEAFDLLHMALTSPHFERPLCRAHPRPGAPKPAPRVDQPQPPATRKFLEIAFGDHPYGRPSTGTLYSAPKIEVTDLKDYYNTLSQEQRQEKKFPSIRAIAAIASRCLDPELVPDHEIGRHQGRNNGAADVRRENRARRRDDRRHDVAHAEEVNDLPGLDGVWPGRIVIGILK